MSDYKGDDTTGFQSPAQDYVEPVIDLAQLLDLRRPGLYPVRVVGHDLRARGIHHGDILIANAAAEPERRRSYKYGGRSVFGWEPAAPSINIPW